MTRRRMPETDQLSLFAPPPPPPDPRRGELEELAGRLPSHVRFGTSSWTFPGWKGLVYHRAYRNDRVFLRDSLAEYAMHPLFRTVGIDRGYYQPTAEVDLAHYASLLPPGFLAVSKVWSEITTPVFPNHPRYGERGGRPNPRFLDPELFQIAMGTPYANAFAAHAGPFVLEVPPMRIAPRAFETALARFLGGVPQGPRFAVELRDPSLLTDRYLGVLREHGATHCFNFWERMPTVGAQLARPGTLMGPFVVARILIPPGRRYADLVEAWAPFGRLVEPQPAMREDVSSLVRRSGELGFDLFVIVNNKAEGSSPLTIEALARALVRPS